MSQIFALFDSLSFLFPYVIAVGAVLFGIGRNNAVKRERVRTESMEIIANAEKKRADTSDKMIVTIIESEQQSHEKVKEAIEHAKNTRSHFSS